MSLSIIPASSGRGVPVWAWACTGCAILPLFLILLALPTLRNIRQTARQSKTGALCLENLRQSCQGVMLYLQDYDDRYPIQTNWIDTTFPYSKDQKIYQCPAIRAQNG